MGTVSVDSTHTTDFCRPFPLTLSQVGARSVPCVSIQLTLSQVFYRYTSGSRLGLRQHRLRGIQGGRLEVGVLLAQAASSSGAQRQMMWRSLGARSMLDERSFMISTLRSQVGFAAAVAHARASPPLAS
jgi:hypothetical protein